MMADNTGRGWSIEPLVLTIAAGTQAHRLLDIQTDTSSQGTPACLFLPMLPDTSMLSPFKAGTPVAV